ncbi:hypothetical protein XNC1_1092 [Xenorhabdus nematophila ATCC 19061]|uniref:Uncharacterized protein n=1 Tax=Xenorhabdus nematophila (strain ATCC 19061 / DSM 3370 / CCUG 14189 / LMG 1036 / NCIMB 9965 / AN6) TaxID=406817 RepID=D3V8W5_XENNA|nr:hypothetical protein XNC1_1092 [Xenorhabdus nematophila ATCC 19061]
MFNLRWLSDIIDIPLLSVVIVVFLFFEQEPVLVGGAYILYQR